MAGPHERVLAVILGGGRGTRLWPLTRERAKPAVPIAGKYRLIDIPLSNCLNSGVHQVSILTQFNSASLHRHISQTYHFDLFHPGWVQILAAEQTTTNLDWYQGTADAVRKQLFEIESAHAQDVLILAGDHLYRMDYGRMIEFHRQVEADVTVAVRPITRPTPPASVSCGRRGTDGSRPSPKSPASRQCWTPWSAAPTPTCRSWARWGSTSSAVLR